MSNTTKRTISNAHVQFVTLETAGLKPTIPSPPTLTPEDDDWINNSDILIGEIAYNKVDNLYYYRDNSDNILILGNREVLGYACSDETTDLTTGTDKITFHMPFAMTLIEVITEVNTTPTGSTFITDLNKNGVTTLSTKSIIPIGSEISDPAIISVPALAKADRMTVDFDQIGSGTAGKGHKIYLVGYRT